ncbi:MAG: hypothetical protein R3E08_09675 [Thiotrichaceae bacterium]
MHQPIAVQIDYQDWLKIEQFLNTQHAQQVDDFFAHHSPVQSFSTIEPTEYVNNLRQNSRLLQGDEND